MNTSNTIKALSPASRVWIYQSNRPFTAEETEEIRQHLAGFAAQWVSHDKKLRAAGDVAFNRFVILMVDESAAGASGCSIDKSVHFIKALEQRYQVDLFDRMRFAYQKDGEVFSVNKAEFKKHYDQGAIDDETLVFDTLVDKKSEFDRNWLKPLKESWHYRLVK